MADKARKKICGICGGSGQVSFFRGVSRFLLSTEECETCAGTGLQLAPVDSREENNRPAKPDRKKTRK